MIFKQKLQQFVPNKQMQEVNSLLHLPCFFFSVTQIPIQYCPVLTPTYEQFKNFTQFTQYLDTFYKPHHGMVKIIPPPEWTPTSQHYQQRLNQLTIKGPIQQSSCGKEGVYEFKHMVLNNISYNDYVKENKAKETITQGKTAQKIQSLFWSTLAFSSAVYGADLLGSLMNGVAGDWNLNNLPTYLSKAIGTSLKGVNSSYCYVGSWKSCFCWHKQDLDLSAINYLHFGKSKFWYCIQWQDGKTLEKEAKSHFGPHFTKCPEYMRHKTIMINPYHLKRKYPSLKITKIEQKPNQFIIAFGGAYHCGFNFGLNVAEAVNFSTVSWLRQLPFSRHCLCRKSTVKASHKQILTNLQDDESINSSSAFQYFKEKTDELQQEQKELEGKELEKQVIKKCKKIAKQKKNGKKKKDKKVIVNKRVFDVVDYIQCDKCNLWRIIPEDKTKDDFGQYFECSELKKECWKEEEEKNEGTNIIQI